LARLSPSFTETHVRPRHGEYIQQKLKASDGRSVVIEEEKPAPSAQGIWNLFTPQAG
jgi:hypothetical protein